MDKFTVGGAIVHLSCTDEICRYKAFGPVTPLSFRYILLRLVEYTAKKAPLVMIGDYRQATVALCADNAPPLPGEVTPPGAWIVKHEHEPLFRALSVRLVKVGIERHVFTGEAEAIVWARVRRSSVRTSGKGVLASRDL